MPDELSHAHTFFGREVRSGVAPLGRNYLLTKICEEIDRSLKLSGRDFYADGQMINRNVINYVTKAFGLNSFSTNMAAAGELKCGDSSLFSKTLTAPSSFNIGRAAC